MMLPTIHSNGSSVTQLLEDMNEASQALRQAIEKLEIAGPDGRDYYPQGSPALPQAQKEHRERVQALFQVRKELLEIIEYLLDQEDQREQGRA